MLAKNLVANILISYQLAQQANATRHRIITCGNVIAKILTSECLRPESKDSLISYIQFISNNTAAVEEAHISSITSDNNQNNNFINLTPCKILLNNTSNNIVLCRQAWGNEKFNDYIMYLKTLITDAFLYNINAPHIVEYDDLGHPVLVDTLLTKAVKIQNQEFATLLYILRADFNQERLHLYHSANSGYDKPLTLALKRKNHLFAIWLHRFGAKVELCCYNNGEFDQERCKVVIRLINELKNTKIKNTLKNSLNFFKQSLDNF